MRMMKSILFVFAYVLVFAAHANPKALFDQGNTLYQEGSYFDAITAYDSVVAKGYLHAETFYNLGNAHYRVGHLGQAILSYERALKLDPNNEDIQHNLKVANRGVVDEFNVVPTPALQRVFQDFSGLFSSAGWSILGLVCFALMLLFAIVFLYKNRKASLFSAMVLCAVFGAVFEGIAYGKHQIEQREFALITAPNSYVKSAPAEKAEDLFILHEGTKFQVLDAFQGWYKIKLADGKIGWILGDGVSVI